MTEEISYRARAVEEYLGEDATAHDRMALHVPARERTIMMMGMRALEEEDPFGGPLEVEPRHIVVNERPDAAVYDREVPVVDVAHPQRSQPSAPLR